MRFVRKSCGIVCLSLLSAAPVAAQTVPLRQEGPAVSPCPLDAVTLSSRSGLSLRAPNEGEASWRAVLSIDTSEEDRARPAWTLLLRRPDYTIAAQKSFSPGSCPAAAELLAILLAAHVPQFALAPPPPPPPAELSPPTPPPPPTRFWRVALAGGVAGFGDHLGAVLRLSGELETLPSLVLGLQLGLSPWISSPAGGEVTSMAVDGRLRFAYRFAPGALSFDLGALVGGRLTYGATSGLLRNDSATIGSFALGAGASVWWSALGRLSFGLGLDLLWLLPRPAFDVDGAGEVYRANAPTVELVLALGWGS